MKEKVFLSLKDDLLFKEALTHPDNRHILIDYLATMTHFEKEYLKSVKMVVEYESILSKTKIKDKNMRGDVIIRFANYIINLEAYTYFDNASFDKSTSYVMRIFSTQLDRGKDYMELESVIQINVIDNVKTEFSDKIKSTYNLINTEDINDKLLADKFVIKYYRLDKAKEAEYNKDNRELRWLRFIGSESAVERKEIAEGDEIMMELDKWAEEYVNDEKTKKIFGKWAEHIALNKGIAQGFEQGVEQGIEQGIEQNNKKIINNLLSMGTSMSDICKITGLLPDEIIRCD